ncbi:MAG: hypothetical protein V4508_18610 [Pseudomonadota bacterium]
MTSAPIVAAVLAPLILWRIYKRVQRLMVRQRSQAWRHWIAVGLFPLLIAALGVLALGHPLALAALLAGVSSGVALGLLGLGKTKFERLGSDFFYTPHAGIGLAVSLVFVARLLYRAYEYYALDAAGRQDFSQSPLTLLAFGILAGYYLTFAAGVLRYRRANALSE